MSKIIAFEGIDGVGKTTQINAVSQSLTKAGIEHIVTQELSGSEARDKLKNLLVSEEYDFDGYDELLIISLARRYHYRTVIKPALDEGKLILLDRFVESTWAYQGGGRKIPDRILQFFQDEIWQVPTPDLTIYLKGASHREEKQDKFELENAEFFDSALDMYEKRQNNFWRIFYAQKNFDFIQSMIQDEIMHFLTCNGLVNK